MRPDGRLSNRPVRAGNTLVSSVARAGAKRSIPGWPLRTGHFETARSRAQTGLPRNLEPMRQPCATIRSPGSTLACRCSKRPNHTRFHNATGRSVPPVCNRRWLHQILIGSASVQLTPWTLRWNADWLSMPSGILPPLRSYSPLPTPPRQGADGPDRSQVQRRKAFHIPDGKAPGQ